MINWTPKLIEARDFFRAAHDSIGQKRKYSGDPYFYHTEEVGEIVSEITQNEDIIIAAFSHDTGEDVFPYNSFYNVGLIKSKFGEFVTQLMIELTDVYTKENYPDLNRIKRKLLERERLGRISAEAKLVKLADIISNTKDIVAHDQNFARIYIDEKIFLLPFLLDNIKYPLENGILMRRAYDQIEEAKKILYESPAKRN